MKSSNKKKENKNRFQITPLKRLFIQMLGQIIQLEGGSSASSAAHLSAAAGTAHRRSAANLRSAHHRSAARLRSELARSSERGGR